jgi:hypothetical protein
MIKSNEAKKEFLIISRPLSRNTLFVKGYRFLHSITTQAASTGVYRATIALETISLLVASKHR